MESEVRTVRLAEAVAVLSIAADIGMGQPLHYGLRACLVAVGLGNALGIGPDDLLDTYYLALLRFAGCTADADIAAEVFGDEKAMRGKFAYLDFTNSSDVLLGLIRNFGEGSPPLTRTRAVVRALLGMPRLYSTGRAHCEVAAQMADRLGLPLRLQGTLNHIFERWDGKGFPGHIKGEAIALPARIVLVAYDAVTFDRLGGPDAALEIVRKRSGKTYDPAIVECFRGQGAKILEAAAGESAWEAVLAAEPGAHPCLEGDHLEAALRAMADFTDLQSPYLRGHSTGVSALAADAAAHCHLSQDDVRIVRWAGLIHDLGRVGVPAGIWGKEGPLSEEEWERVRLHPYYLERVLGRCEALRAVTEIGCLHHERLDGSGYHRRLPQALLPLAARILAAADVYHAMSEPRPHRPALSAGQAETELRREVKAGKLDGAAVDAVLTAAGHRVRRTRHSGPGGLSKREVEVLAHLARGLTNREIATRLTVSRATVDHHIRHIYGKIGVSTRAAAALYAMRHDLLHSTIFHPHDE